MRILWLKTELLHPVDKGGKIRTYQMLRELKRDHQVTYLTLDDGKAAADSKERANEYCHDLITIPHSAVEKFTLRFYLQLAGNLLSSEPYFIRKYDSPAMRAEITRVLARDEFDVVVCDFLNPAVNLPEVLPAPTLLFQHNVEAMIWKRHYQVQKNPIKKAYLYGQWLKAFSFEREVCRRFDYVAAVSRDDAAIMKRDYGTLSVADIPTGVDTEFFRPDPAVPAKPLNLVFTGSMDWLPNEDAIKFFIADVYPQIKRKVPGVSLTVVGRNPSDSLRAIARDDDSIEVTGRVKDVRPYLDRASLFIVPIRIGGGTRLKIYEAMAMEKAVVSTTIGAEGLPVKNGEELILADTAAEFAEEIIRLLKAPEIAKEFGQRAASLVREKFGWQGVTAEFVDLCNAAIRAHSNRSETFAVSNAIPLSS